MIVIIVDHPVNLAVCDLAGERVGHLPAGRALLRVPSACVASISICICGYVYTYIYIYICI